MLSIRVSISVLLLETVFGKSLIVLLILLISPVNRVSNVLIVSLIVLISPLTVLILVSISVLLLVNVVFNVLISEVCLSLTVLIASSTAVNSVFNIPISVIILSVNSFFNPSTLLLILVSLLLTMSVNLLRAAVIDESSAVNLLTLVLRLLFNVDVSSLSSSYLAFISAVSSVFTSILASVIF